MLLKAESLQRTGSFKIRGALSKLAALGDGCGGGVVCASAGNHAQALAAAARARGVPCEVVMPLGAPVTKVEGAEALGARVLLHGDGVDECLEFARERGRRAGRGVRASVRGRRRDRRTGRRWASSCWRTSPTWRG